MNSLESVLSIVTQGQPDIRALGQMRAFPGLTFWTISKHNLASGFSLGDFMSSGEVSVAVLASEILTSRSSEEPRQESLSVWRVTLKSGSIALMALRCSGNQDDADDEVAIEGHGAFVEDPSLAAFVEAEMVQTQRATAFEEFETFIQDARAFQQRALKLFGQDNEWARQATDALSLSAPAVS